MKRHYLFMLCTVFLYCCLKLLSCASLIKAQNVLPTPYLQCNKITSMDFYVEFIWQQQFAFVDHSFKAFHFTKLHTKENNKMVDSFTAVMDITLCWRQSFPFTQALSVDCEQAPLEPYVTHEPSRVKGWWLGTNKWDNYPTTVIFLWEGKK